MDDLFYIDLMFFVISLNIYTPLYFIITCIYIWLIFVYYEKENVLLRADLKRQKKEAKRNEKDNSN